MDGNVHMTGDLDISLNQIGIGFHPISGYVEMAALSASVNGDIATIPRYFVVQQDRIKI